MTDRQPWEFTCKKCGGHALNVTRTFTILAGLESETWQEWGALEANHHWHFEFKEEIDKEGKMMMWMTKPKKLRGLRWMTMTMLKKGISASSAKMTQAQSLKNMKYSNSKAILAAMSFM